MDALTARATFRACTARMACGTISVTTAAEITFGACMCATTLATILHVLLARTVQTLARALLARIVSVVGMRQGAARPAALARTPLRIQPLDLLHAAHVKLVRIQPWKAPTPVIVALPTPSHGLGATTSPTAPAPPASSAPRAGRAPPVPPAPTSRTRARPPRARHARLPDSGRRRRAWTQQTA